MFTEVPISGLRYIPQYIDTATHEALLVAVDREPWLCCLRRQVQQYGHEYHYRRRTVRGVGPLPGWATPLAARLQSDGVLPWIPDQLIVNEYQPGQGIAAHIDSACFDDIVVSISLGSSCVMQFTRSGARDKKKLFVEAKSAVVLSGDARSRWRHSIPARKSDAFLGQKVPRDRRISLTFRRVRADAQPQSAEGLRRDSKLTTSVRSRSPESPATLEQTSYTRESASVPMYTSGSTRWL